MPHRCGAFLTGTRSRRRSTLIGRTYVVTEAVHGEIRRACREELRIFYSGRVFDSDVWKALGQLGSVSVLEASKLNPRMKDLIRVHASGLRLEGALGGTSLHAFYSLDRPRERRRAVEHILRALEK